MLYKVDTQEGENMSIEKSMKKIRYLLDMNQTELAKALGVTTSSINCYEHGKRSPGRKTLKRMSELIKQNNLDISLEEFLI